MSTDAALQLLPRLSTTSEVDCDERDALEKTLGETHDRDLDETEDSVLLQAISAGSKEALGLLFRRHGRLILNVASRILRDTSEADDLRQEVFLFVFERARLFDPQRGTALSWLVQVTYHRAYDRRRFLTHRGHYGSVAFEEQHIEAVAAPNASEIIDGQRLLNWARQELSVDQRETLELHFFEGYSLREIAEKNGQNVGNVRNHYYRGLERLRAHLFSRKRQ